MIEAFQVDLDKTFAALLERGLNACGAFGGKRIEVLNLGVSSYALRRSCSTSLLRSKYSPDMVMLAFFAGNDVRNNSKALEPEIMRPFFLLSAISSSKNRLSPILQSSIGAPASPVDPRQA